MEEESAPAGFELGLAYPDEQELEKAVEQLVADQVASRIAGHDASLWGPEAEEEASKRLGWVDLHLTSVPLVEQVTSLRDDLRGRGLDRVVLCGMGGSSLAPEVICASAGVPLTVLDSSDPDMVREAIDADLESTVVVVSSKSGGTVETDSQRRAYEHAFEVAGIDPAERIIVVTDPGSPLDDEATETGYRVFRADPQVGGRYSALTAFGLVPSGLAGADIGALLQEADEIAEDVAADDETNPALVLAALIGVANARGVDKLLLADAGSRNVGFGDWIEQLVAESTGKQGRGILPVVVAGRPLPQRRPEHSRRGRGHDRPDARRPPGRRLRVRVRGGCTARGAVPAVGVRHRGRRPDDRHRPVRPARRRERQAGRTRHARRRVVRARGRVHRPGRHGVRHQRLAARGRHHRPRGGRGPAGRAGPRARLRRGAGLPRPLPGPEPRRDA